MGGLIPTLEDLKPYFAKRGLILEVSNETEDLNGYFWDHRITLNGKEYIAYQGSVSPYEAIDCWGIACDNLLNMINDQLEKQKSIERVYASGYGNDGSLLFLTEAQFNFLESIDIKDYWKPRKSNSK
ncbi:MAG: hypothetical protein AAF487_00520 [Bacteroidota bacterium]